MATTLDKIFQNFIYRIEAITPTSNICGKNFNRLDPKQIALNESAGLERNFVITYLGSDSDDTPTDEAIRTAEHKFLVQVLYNPGRGWEVAHELILNDRHDLIKALRDDAKFDGYDSSHTTDAIRLHGRIRENDEIDMSDPDVWVYRAIWKCYITEEE